GLHATVNDPSKEEWSEAFQAPSKPYRWHDEARVGIYQEHPTDRRYVQKKPPSAKKCACYAKLGVREPGDYERVWIEATTPKPEVTAEARKELLQLAAMADGADDLCSTLFPLFAALDRGPRPVDLVGPVQLGQQQGVKLVPDAGALLVLEAGAAAT